MRIPPNRSGRGGAASPLRIGLVAPPWVALPPPGHQGIEAVVRTLATGLRSAGHEVTVFATGDSSLAVADRWWHPRALGPRSTGPRAELVHVLHAYEALADCDVVHDHTLVGPVVAAGRRTPPVATTAHGPFESDLGDVYRAVASRVALVAVSHDQAATAPDTPIAAVIHHGVDLEHRPFGVGDGGYAAYLGAMHPAGGVHLAVDAARRAGVPLRIAGAARDRLELDYFEATVRPALGREVAFDGELCGREAAAFLGGASCLLSPSTWREPSGMAMIEALACGTPVVATPVGPAGEIVEDGTTGFVRPRHGLADAVVEAAALSRAACRAAAERRFSAERMAREHVALYRRLRRTARDPAGAAAGVDRGADTSRPAGARGAAGLAFGPVPVPGAAVPRRRHPR